MPNIKVTAAEMRWVPTAARRVCYSCGSFLEKEQDKENCRLCYDVFCTSCVREKVALPPHYGYSEKQPVCRVCALLLNTFPTFGSRLHCGQGGMLLPPRVAVVVTSCDLPYYAPEDPPKPPSIQQRGAPPPSSASWLGRFMQKFRSSDRRKSSASPSASLASSGRCTHLDEQPSSYTRVPHKKFINSSAQRAVLMSLVSWRPMNPETKLCIGPITICIRDILKVYSGTAESGVGGVGGGGSTFLTGNTNHGSGTGGSNKHHHHHHHRGKGGGSKGGGGGSAGSGGGFSDGRVTIVLQGGYSLSLIVGVTTFDRDSSPLVVRKKNSSTLTTERSGGGGKNKDSQQSSPKSGQQQHQQADLSDGEEYEAEDPYCEMFGHNGILVSSDTTNGGPSSRSSRGSFGGGSSSSGGRRGSWIMGVTGGGSNSGSKKGGDGSLSATVDFMTDPKESAHLAENLVGLVRECREHFAFGRASMALHKDLVPE